MATMGMEVVKVKKLRPREYEDLLRDALLTALQEAVREAEKVWIEWGATLPSLAGRSSALLSHRMTAPLEEDTEWRVSVSPASQGLTLVLSSRNRPNGGWRPRLERHFAWGGENWGAEVEELLEFIAMRPPLAFLAIITLHTYPTFLPDRVGELQAAWDRFLEEARPHLGAFLEPPEEGREEEGE